LEDLVHRYGGRTFTNFSGLFHHSYPNYLAMAGGRQFNELHWFLSDYPVHLPDDPTHQSIADRLREKGLIWKNYAEGYSSGCRYLARHVPFLSFTSVMNRDPQNIVDADDPAHGFFHDASGASFPNYAFYTPNRDNDGHDTCPQFSCNWVKVFLADLPTG